MFKKMAGMTLAVLALFCFSLPLAAQEKKADNPYKPFQLEVPAGWKTDFNPGAGKVGQSLKLTSPDGLAIFSVQLETLSPGQWERIIEEMSVKPAPDHGPPNIQGDDNFVVTFNDAATGMTGRKIYQRIAPDRYVIQTAYGFHPDLPPLINSVQVTLDDGE